MILLIDNYDSFSYNLFQLISEVYLKHRGITLIDDEIDKYVKVVRNDEITIEEIRNLQPEAIVLSPGPGKPANAGICISVVQELVEEYPILGVCLGHQAICEAFGGVVSYAPQLMHGKTSVARLDVNSPIFQGMNQDIQVARYHSLIAPEEKLPTSLRVIARTREQVMAVEHTQYPVYGLQFHPESILTPEGKTIIQNFMEVIDND